MFNKCLHGLEKAPILYSFWQSWSLESERRLPALIPAFYADFSLMKIGAAAFLLSQHFLSPFYPTNVVPGSLNCQ